jgi:DNA end-binding protein Ku
MARALWKGSISFGLVNIPIELHTAVRDTRPHFRMLHTKDKSPVRFERVCIRDGHPVAWQDLVKGYEYQKGRFVVLTKEDFKAAAVEKTRTVEIIDFVKAEEIDDRFFETPYYVVPAKGGERAYALLREAIRDSGRIGVAKFILRDAQHLAAVEVIAQAIVLSVMRFAEELVDAAQFGFPAAKDVRKAELDMAKALVNSLAAEWDPNKYTDQYRENLTRIIKAKMKGRAITLEPEQEPRHAEVVDLMERLRRSLAQSGGEAGSSRRAAKPKRTAGRTAPKKRARRAA